MVELKTLPGELFWELLPLGLSDVDCAACLLLTCPHPLKAPLLSTQGPSATCLVRSEDVYVFGEDLRLLPSC